jgi:hypothetical protein
MISDRLTEAVERENLLSLIGYSSKLERKIQAIVGNELQSDLIEMNERLESLVRNFAEKLQSDYDQEFEVNNRRTSANSGIKGEINTLIGGGIVAGGGLLGATAALGAIGAIGATAAEVVAASSVAGAAVAGGGILGKLGLFFGVGKTAGAAGAASLAQGGLLTALVSGVVPIVGGVVVASLAYKFGTSFAKDKTVKNIPPMVEKQLNESAKTIEESAKKMLDAVLSQFEERINDTLAQRQDELDTIIGSLGSLNKEAKLQEIEQDLREIGRLSIALNGVN